MTVLSNQALNNKYMIIEVFNALNLNIRQKAQIKKWSSVAVNLTGQHLYVKNI